MAMLLTILLLLSKLPSCCGGIFFPSQKRLGVLSPSKRFVSPSSLLFQSHSSLSNNHGSSSSSSSSRRWIMRGGGQKDYHVWNEIGHGDKLLSELEKSKIWTRGGGNATTRENNDSQSSGQEDVDDNDDREEHEEATTTTTLMEDDEDSSANVDRMEYADAYDDEEEQEQQEDSTTNLNNNTTDYGSSSSSSVGSAEWQTQIITPTNEENNAKQQQQKQPPEEDDGGLQVKDNHDNGKSLEQPQNVDSKNNTIRLSSEITPEMKIILLKELHYKPHDLRVMRPEIASILVAKKLKRPLEGLPIHWYPTNNSQTTPTFYSSSSWWGASLGIGLILVGIFQILPFTPHFFSISWDSILAVVPLQILQKQQQPPQKKKKLVVVVEKPSTPVPIHFQKPVQATPQRDLYQDLFALLQMDLPPPKPTVPPPKKPLPPPKKPLPPPRKPLPQQPIVNKKDDDDVLVDNSSVRPGEGPTKEPWDESGLDRFITAFSKRIRKLAGGRSP